MTTAKYIYVSKGKSGVPKTRCVLAVYEFTYRNIKGSSPSLNPFPLIPVAT